MTTKQAAHTPGPLRVYGGLLNGYGIVGEHGNIYSTNDARPLQIFNGQTEAANARRIVACWNALDGIPTSDLEEWERSGFIGGIRADAQAKTMKMLLEACKAVVALAHRCAGCDGSSMDPLDDRSACRGCGGVGEIAHAGPELGALRASIAAAEEA